MYNQEIKERFCRTYVAAGKERTGCRSMFDTIGVYEESLGKDLAEMTKDEVICATRLMVVGAYKTAVSIQSKIKDYVKWCTQNQVFTNVNLDLIGFKIDDVDASAYLAKTIFKDEDELIRELQTVRRFDEGFTEGIILILAWLGIEQKDVLSIKTHDVDLARREINYRKYDKTIVFSEKICDVLRIYEKTKEGSRPAGGSSRPVYRDDSFNTYVRKYCPRGQLGVKPLEATNLRKMVNDVNKLYTAQGKESRLWNGNIIASGALYRLKNLEDNGVDVFSTKNRVDVVQAFAIDADMYEISWLYKSYKRAFNW